MGRYCLKDMLASLTHYFEYSLKADGPFCYTISRYLQLIHRTPLTHSLWFSISELLEVHSVPPLGPSLSSAPAGTQPLSGNSFQTS